MQTKSAEKALRSARKAQMDQEESSAQIPSGISLRRSPQPSSHSADGAAQLTYTPALPKSQSKFASAVSSQLAEVKAFSDLLAAEGPPLPTFEQMSHRANLPHDIQEVTLAASALAVHQSPAEIHANSLEAAAIHITLQIKHELVYISIPPYYHCNIVHIYLAATIFCHIVIQNLFS